ncbi:hypothetical protein WAI453_003084 [Rhynchosporium graminicola]|uniref:Uncharacterized protein n=1 Tax=Rhynchosporium graminicola TaxID=2792576 RepID=A0A1E1LJ47_9HELO|nr:uncharacterized protein RCO7_07516 [Rhynchosporium commune]
MSSEPGKLLDQPYRLNPTLPPKKNCKLHYRKIKNLEADLHHAKVEIGTRHEEGFRLKLDAELSSDRAEATAQTMKDLRARDAMPMGDWATETSETKNLKDQIEGLDRKIDGYQEDIHDLIDTNCSLAWQQYRGRVRTLQVRHQQATKCTNSKERRQNLNVNYKP